MATYPIQTSKAHWTVTTSTERTKLVLSTGTFTVDACPAVSSTGKTVSVFPYEWRAWHPKTRPADRDDWFVIAPKTGAVLAFAPGLAEALAMV